MSEIYLDKGQAEMVKDLQERLDQARSGDLEGYAAVWLMKDDAAIPDCGGYFDPYRAYMGLHFLADTLKAGVYGIAIGDDEDE